MKDAEILERVDRLRIWQRRGERAPHKPLLLLMALGKFTHDEISIPYETIEQKLGQLLLEFGPSRQRQEPMMPFWHLQSDKLWEVEADADLPIGSNGKRPKVDDLRRLHARGRLPRAVGERLRDNPRLIHDISERILEAHFPDSLHDDILAAVGLARTWEIVRRRRRDPDFRTKVLDAYGHRCAMCGLEMRLGAASFAVEAAHVKWHQAGGPDTESNGLSLCSLHHKSFDMGAFTIVDGKVSISKLVQGNEQCRDALFRHDGRPMLRPAREAFATKPEFLAWHRSQVFKAQSTNAIIQMT